MTARISRRQFSDKLDCDNPTLDALERDPRTRGVDLRAADLDGDGVISNYLEERALARIVDGLDGRSDGWITLTSASGAATPALPVVDALAARETVLPEIRLTVERMAPSRRSAVVIVGMSETAYAEAAALRRRAAVLLVTDARRGVGGAASGELRTPEQVRERVAQMQLPDAQSRAVESAILAAPPDGRSELAELAAIWAPAERGESIPGRLLLSGHGDGEQIFGDDHDSLRSRDIQSLARAMPRAAAQIDALHIGACQHGYQPRVESWSSVFPNVRSIWGYAGFSSSGEAAFRQQAAWERATRSPDHGGSDVHPGLARGTRRGDNVAVWTRDRGYAGPTQRDMSDIVSDAQNAGSEYARYMSGELTVVNPRTGPVWQRYQWFQEIVNHSDFGDQDADFRSWARTEMDQALRLRFFTPEVTRAFDRAYARPIEAGYRALGLTPPRFGGMSRRDALAEVERFRRALAARPDAPAEATALERLLVEGLVELRASRIPSEWI